MSSSFQMFNSSNEQDAFPRFQDNMIIGLENFDEFKTGRVLTVKSVKDYQKFEYTQVSQAMSPVANNGLIIQPGFALGAFTVIGSFNYNGTLSEGYVNEIILICSSSLYSGSISAFRLYDYTNQIEIIPSTYIPFTQNFTKQEFTFTIPCNDNLPSTPTILEFQVQNPITNPGGTLIIYGMGVVHGKN